MNVLQLVERETREGDEDAEITGYAFDGDAVYPAMVDYCRKIARDEVDIPQYVALYRADIKRLPQSAWDDALIPYGEHADESPGISRARATERNQALELARLVWTAYAREQTGGPIRVHVLNQPQWKLYPVRTPLPNSEALGEFVFTESPQEA